VTVDWRRAQRKRSGSITTNGAVFGRPKNRSRRERKRERERKAVFAMRERERGERQESSILLTPLLAQSFSWKSDRTRNEKKGQGFSSGGRWREWGKGRGVFMTANMAMVEEPLYPNAILIDELKNDHIQLRLNSILHRTGTRWGADA
jgi:hypothetical protein